MARASATTMPGNTPAEVATTLLALTNILPFSGEAITKGLSLISGRLIAILSVVRWQNHIDKNRLCIMLLPFASLKVLLHRNRTKTAVPPFELTYTWSAYTDLYQLHLVSEEYYARHSSVQLTREKLDLQSCCKGETKIHTRLISVHETCKPDL